MKITIYTIPDCQFSKQEKDYFASHKLVFEERDLEKNKEYLTEMLAISNNFAGTPVTKIEKDNGLSVILKGFTKEEFDKELGFAASAAQATVPPPAAKPQVPAGTGQQSTPPVQKPSVPPPNPTPTPAPQVPVNDQPTTPPAAPSVPTPPQPQTPPPQQDQQLKSILNDLQSMSGTSQNTQSPQPITGTGPSVKPTQSS